MILEAIFLGERLAMASECFKKSGKTTFAAIVLQKAENLLK